MLKGLMQRGIEPLVVFPARDGLNTVLQKQGISTIVLSYRMDVWPPFRTIKDCFLFLPRLCVRRFLNMRAYSRLLSVARQFKPELIHTNVSVINIGYKVAMKLRIPHVWHIREYGDLDFKLYHYPSRRYFLRSLKADGSYSISITKDIFRYNGLQEEGKHFHQVIYNGILSDTEVCLDKTKEPYFLFAGRLEANKGIAELLKAFAEFKQLRPASVKRLWIAGDTENKSYDSYLKFEVVRLQIASEVEFLGMREDVLDLMAKAYLMIVPSVSEGFGRITSEAMFRGALVLGRDTAGTKEQFDNGRELTGQEIGLRFTNHEELVQRMCEVEDRGIESYFSMIERSQTVVRELYSVERHSRQIYDFYTDILR
ncbi:MAG: glycosyltransferase family 4 protein [Bacteroidaceae bacterium]